MKEEMCVHLAVHTLMIPSSRSTARTQVRKDVIIWLVPQEKKGLARLGR